MPQPIDPIDPTTRLDLTLEAQQWNTIIEVLCRSTGFPYVATAPLIEALGQQMRAKAEQHQQMRPQPQRGVASAA